MNQCPHRPSQCMIFMHTHTQVVLHKRQKEKEKKTKQKTMSALLQLKNRKRKFQRKLKRTKGTRTHDGPSFLHREHDDDEDIVSLDEEDTAHTGSNKKLKYDEYGMVIREDGDDDDDSSDDDDDDASEGDDSYDSGSSDDDDDDDEGEDERRVRMAREYLDKIKSIEGNSRHNVDDTLLS